MKIVYPPTEKTLQKLETIRQFHEQGMSGNMIAKKIGLSREYVYALLVWDREYLKEKHE